MKFKDYLKEEQILPKIFLGGTCNNSKWRDKFITNLNKEKYNYFNPIVDNWSEKDYQNELIERENCDICLYVITPEMSGVYSIAEVIDDSNKRPKKTIFCVINKENNKTFDNGQLKSLDKVGDMVKGNGGKYYKTIDELYKDFK
jgi:Nucleoside 2-deoxyribosyltransferase like